MEIEAALGSGTAALAARCLYNIRRDLSPDELLLLDSAKLLALEDMRREAGIAWLAKLIDEAGLHVIVIKGIAVAQSYAETYLRPFGDVDIILRSCDRVRFMEVIAPYVEKRITDYETGEIFLVPAKGGWLVKLDLHVEVPPIYGITTDALFEQSIRAPVRLQGIFFPGPEHHLRIVTIHLLKHGAWRPLWLCDVAVLIEAAGAGFDWNVYASEDEGTARWMSHAIALARDLLGCDITRVPPQYVATAPDWMTAVVRAEWQHPFASRFITARGLVFKRPLAYAKAHWPNAVLAGFVTQRDVRALPSLIWKLRYVLWRLRSKIQA